MMQRELLGLSESPRERAARVWGDRASAARPRGAAKSALALLVRGALGAVGLGCALFACGQTPAPSQPSASASTTAAATASEAEGPTTEMASPARWVDQRGRNSLGVSLPEGQLTLVAGRRVLIDKQGKVVSVAEEEAPLTALALVKDAGKAVIVGLAGNEVWRFNHAKGSGVLIATLSAPSSDISRVSADGKLIRVQKRGIGPSEVWLNLEGERVEAPQAAPTPEPENKPDLGDSPVLRWVSQAWQAPLIAAVADGLRIGPERALVVSGPDLFEIDLKTGLPVAVRALGGDSSASRLTRLQRRGDQEFAFASHAQRSGYWISPSTPTSLMELRWPSVFSGLAEIKLQSVEQPAAAKSPPVISSSGAVLWHLPCAKGEMPPGRRKA